MMHASTNLKGEARFAHQMEPPKHAHASHEKHTDEVVLTKAVVRMAKLLEVDEIGLAYMLSIPVPTAYRLLQGEGHLRPQETDTWRRAVLLVRLWTSLNHLLKTSQMKTWMDAPNLELHGRPSTLIGEEEGLISVLNYLESKLQH